MIPGPTIIMACTACLGSIAQPTALSGNTFGATQWTDGKCAAPMLQETPWLVRCPHCRESLWTDELEKLGTIAPWESVGAFKGAKLFAWSSLDDYFALLETGGLMPDKLSYVRVSAWWCGNDKRRPAPEGKPLSDRECANLEALEVMLPATVDDALLMKAEAMRELCRFGEAVALLDRQTSAARSAASDFIRGLAEKGDPCVRRLPSVRDRLRPATPLQDKRVLRQLNGHCKSLQHIVASSSVSKQWRGQLKVVLRLLRSSAGHPDATTIAQLEQRLEAAGEDRDALCLAADAVREWTGRTP